MLSNFWKVHIVHKFDKFVREVVVFYRNRFFQICNNQENNNSDLKLDLKLPILRVSKRYLNISQPISDLKFRSEKDYFRSVLEILLGTGVEPASLPISLFRSLSICHFLSSLLLVFIPTFVTKVTK